MADISVFAAFTDIYRLILSPFLLGVSLNGCKYWANWLGAGSSVLKKNKKSTELFLNIADNNNGSTPEG